MTNRIATQYLMFLVNGGLLGILAIVVQLFFFNILGSDSATAYAIAACLTYLPLIALNFLIQRHIIFEKSGRISRFLVANLMIMAFVSAISPICRDLLSDFFGGTVGERSGFILAALIGATPSFLLGRFWVFREGSTGTQRS